MVALFKTGFDLLVVPSQNMVRCLPLLLML